MPSVPTRSAFRTAERMASALPAVLVLACRRPEWTERLLQRIVSSGCREVHVVVDGPRQDRRGDAEQVERTREVVRRFGFAAENLWLREANVGGPFGIPKAIDWFFTRTDRGIIVEDDLLPSPSFFRFAAELLSRYEADPRIAAIHGWTCRLRPPESSYYFSRFAPGWGWATWASRWKDFDREGRLWAEVDPAAVLERAGRGDPGFVPYWMEKLHRVYPGGKMHWDYRWSFTNFVLGRLTIAAGVNLVDNTGWGKHATNTTQRLFCQLPASEMQFPLRHPPTVTEDRDADRDEHDSVFLQRPSMRLRYGVAALARGVRALIAR